MSGIEQRREERLPGTSTVVRLAIAGRAYQAEVRDVSANGVGLRLTGLPPADTDRLRTGRILPVAIVRAGATTTGAARVAWLKAGADGVEVGLELMNGGRPDAEDAPLDLSEVMVDAGLALRCPAALLRSRQLLPLCVIAGHVYVARAGGHDAVGLQIIERQLAMPAVPVAATAGSLRAAIDRVLGQNGQASGSRRAVAADGEAPGSGAMALVDELIATGVLRGASDIHIDPESDRVRVRVRVHGELEELRTLPLDGYTEVVSRIKVMAGMDISERRAPQDGRLAAASADGRQVDVRVATLPTRRGERVTLRLFAQAAGDLRLADLGMGEVDLARFDRAIRRPHGLILITGPTGSGKSTTLYAGLRQLQGTEPLNILTVEDPVEYDLAGVAQMDISQGGERLTFANALRASLRHDPDVLMLGEIRDRETAEMAIRAALTGHLVLSTLHTNSAAGAVTRLVDIGIEPFLVGATLRLVVAQRLVRRLCPVSWTERPLATHEAAALGRPDVAGRLIRDPLGSLHNANRGYVGRQGVFELLPVDEDLGRAIAQGTGEGQLQAILRGQGVPTLADDALAKLLAGSTSVPEVLKAITTW